MTTLTIQATFILDNINYSVNQHSLSPEELKAHLIDCLMKGEKEIAISSGFINAATTKNLQIIP